MMATYCPCGHPDDSQEHACPITYEKLKVANANLQRQLEEKTRMLAAYEAQPVYMFRRHGQDDYCTCSKERFDELSDHPQFDTDVFYAPVSAAHLDALLADAERKGMERAIEIADARRLVYSEEYEKCINNGTCTMNGNIQWARLEGAVQVVEAIRAAAQNLEEQL